MDFSQEDVDSLLPSIESMVQTSSSALSVVEENRRLREILASVCESLQLSAEAQLLRNSASKDKSTIAVNGSNADEESFTHDVNNTFGEQASPESESERESEGESEGETETQREAGTVRETERDTHALPLSPTHWQSLSLSVSEALRRLVERVRERESDKDTDTTTAMTKEERGEGEREGDDEERVREKATDSSSSLSPHTLTETKNDAHTQEAVWRECAEVHPPPPFDLSSPVISHLLQTWTEDSAQINFLTSWISSLKSPAHESYPIGIQITSISRVLRDAFIMLVVPLMRQQSLDPLLVYTREYNAQQPEDADNVNKRSETTHVNSDPFVSLQDVVFDIRVKRVVDPSHWKGVAHPELFRDVAQADLCAHGYRVDSKDYSPLAEINSVLDEIAEQNEDIRRMSMCEKARKSFSDHGHRVDSRDYSSLREINSALDEFVMQNEDARRMSISSKGRVSSKDHSHRVDSKDYSPLAEINSVLDVVANQNEDVRRSKSFSDRVRVQPSDKTSSAAANRVDFRDYSSLREMNGGFDAVDEYESINIQRPPLHGRSFSAPKATPPKLDETVPPQEGFIPASISSWFYGTKITESQNTVSSIAGHNYHPPDLSDTMSVTSESSNADFKREKIAARLEALRRKQSLK